jgi:hypothetical protein
MPTTAGQLARTFQTPRTAWLAVALVMGAATLTAAQPAPDASPSPSTEQQTASPPWWVAERRACEACPRRGVGKAFLQTTAINVMYELANLIRGQVTARITPRTWWANMEQGWVWDLDDFMVNQIGHPYQGNNYFTSARANGLNFYESAAVTSFGSATWEYFGETNSPSLNDFINTTLGGIALGEMFHRAGWLVRDTRATGRKRLWSEIGAMALDPLTGVNRFMSGDASRVSDKPADLVPSTLNGIFAVGALWRGTNTKVIDSTGKPFLEMDLRYGEVASGRSRTPYDAFAVRLTFGGGSGFSEAAVRGRLVGEPLANDRAHFLVVQSYDFQANDAYHFGAQAFNARVAMTPKLTDRTSLIIGGYGGLMVLGAVDSLPPDLEDVPEEPEHPEGEDPGQGVSEGPRYYDYGPGTSFGGFALVSRDSRTVISLTYEGRQLYSLDGVRANHLLQRARLDLIAPLRGKFGIGVTAEYFDRRSFYQDPSQTTKRFHYPQVRAFFSWRVS